MREVLMRPRNSAQLVYRGEVTGAAPWPAIVSEEQRLRVVQILSDPARRTSPGNTVKWLGSMLYVCGVCGGQRVVCGTAGGSRTGKRRPVAYRCGGREMVRTSHHMVRDQRSVDALVTETVIERLGRADALDLLAPADSGIDTVALTAEIGAIRERRAWMAEMATDGLMGQAEYRTAMTKLAGRTAELETQLQGGPTASPLATLVTSNDVRASWEALDLGRQRAVIDLLMTVSLLPSKNRGPKFDPDSVNIAWKA